MLTRSLGKCCVNCMRPYDSTHPLKCHVFRKVKDNQPQSCPTSSSSSSSRDRRYSIRGRQQLKPVKVATMLSTIYKLGYLNTLKNEQDDELEANKVVLCVGCLDVFMKLCDLYDQFNELCEADSYLGTKIGQLNSGIEQLRGSLGGDIESSSDNNDDDVLIKVEEDDEESSWKTDLEKLESRGAAANSNHNKRNDHRQTGSGNRQLTTPVPKNSGQECNDINTATLLASSSSSAPPSTIIIPVVAAVTFVNPNGSMTQPMNSPQVNSSTNTKDDEPIDGTQDMMSVTDDEGEEEIEHDFTVEVEPKFVCRKCYMEFPSLSSMEVHKQIYHIRRKTDGITHDVQTSKPNEASIPSDPLELPHPGFKCLDQRCGSSFVSQVDLELHSAHHRHGEKFFRCTDCPQSFYTKSEAIQHYTIHVTGKPLEIECHKCSTVFGTKEDFKFHMMDAHPKQAPSSSRQERTNKSTQNKTIYICSEDGCDKSFNTKKGLDSHSERHAIPRPYICTKCPKAFSNKVLLFNHQETHFEFKCPHEKCPRKFMTEAEVTQHFQKCDGQSETFLCDLCAKVFTTLASFRTHKRFHERGKQFKCSYGDCPKAFAFKRQLEEHERLHTSTRPFACPIEGCGKTFVAQHSVNIHVKNCHEDKSHLCPHCGLAFSRKANLQFHLVTHSEDRPHVCDVCDKSFKTILRLKGHQLVHACKKRYLCSFTGCDKGFIRSNGLKRHVQTHTGQKPYVCKKCGMSFPDNRPLKRHLVTHEDEDDD